MVTCQRSGYVLTKGPERRNLVTTLFEVLRSSENLFAAWRHVKRSALNSRNPNIQGKASEFEHQHQRYLKRIQAELRGGNFVFDEVEGVLKDKKKREAQGKDPRPIAIGTIKNRVAQRAILQILQPRVTKNTRDFHSKFMPIRDASGSRLTEESV